MKDFDMRKSRDTCGQSLRISEPLDLFEAHESIKTSSANSSGAIGYVPRDFCIFSLPHQDPKTNCYERINGQTGLSVLSSSDLGVPFGRVSRLLLVWLTSQAVYTKNPMIELEGCQSEFFKRKLGILGTGGKQGTIARYGDQFERLTMSRFGITDQRSAPFHFSDYLIAQSIVPRGVKEVWSPSIPVSIKLGSDFYKSIIEESVQIDLRAVRSLQSTYALDLYFYLAYFLPRLKKPLSLTWEQLLSMLGYDVSAENPPAYRAAKSRLLKHIREIHLVYPDAKLRVQKSFLEMAPSPPFPSQQFSSLARPLQIGLEGRTVASRQALDGQFSPMRET